MMLFCALLSTGCASDLKPMTIKLNSNFDQKEAHKLLEEGNNSIHGKAHIMQQDGSIVTCAGNPVKLIPATAYAQERISYLYGWEVDKFIPVYRDLTKIAKSVAFVPDAPAYQEFLKVTVCNPQGYFSFSQLADGEFYVHTAVMLGNEESSKGLVMIQRVKVSGGETQEIALTPTRRPPSIK